MFAVIETGGKQYKVAKNQVIKVEKLPDAEAGSIIVFDQVLAFSDGKAVKIGTPVLEGTQVSATVIEHARDDKIIVFKKKRRHNYRRKIGHRQDITWLRIAEIGSDVATKAAPKKAAEKKEAKPAAEKTVKAESKPAASTKKEVKKPAAKKASPAKKKTDAKE